MSDPINPETIADEFGIKSLGVVDGVPTLTTEPTSEQARELVLAMSLACGRMLDDDEAPNYVEFEVSPAGRPGYVVHVRRAAGPSPHTLRKKAEARVAELEAQLRDEGNRVGRLEDQLRAACTEGADARARAAELETICANWEASHERSKAEVRRLPDV